MSKLNYNQQVSTDEVKISKNDLSKLLENKKPSNVTINIDAHTVNVNFVTPQQLEQNYECENYEGDCENHEREDLEDICDCGHFHDYICDDCENGYCDQHDFSCRYCEDEKVDCKFHNKSLEELK